MSQVVQRGMLMLLATVVNVSVDIVIFNKGTAVFQGI